MEKTTVTIAGRKYERTLTSNGGAIYRVVKNDGTYSCLNPGVHRALICRIETAIRIGFAALQCRKLNEIG